MGPGGGRAYAPPAGEGGAGPTGASPAPFGEEEEEEGASLARRSWSCWGGTSPLVGPPQGHPGPGEEGWARGEWKNGCLGRGKGVQALHLSVCVCVLVGFRDLEGVGPTRGGSGTFWVMYHLKFCWKHVGLRTVKLVSFCLR